MSVPQPANATALGPGQAAEARRRNAGLLEAALEVAELGSWVADLSLQGRLELSREVYRIFGVTEEQFDHSAATFFDMVHPDDRAAVADVNRRVIEQGGPFHLDHRIVRPDGVVRWVHQRGFTVRDAQGHPVQILGIVQDITEKRLIEQQLAHAQRMEAIGGLTGGMAHDFNNLLGIIIGNLDLLRERIGVDTELCGFAKEALDAAHRGAVMTRQLLAFARRQPLQPQRIEVNELAARIARFLTRLLGDSIAISLDLADEVWPILADPTQLEAALTNLATNARDAMQVGGRLLIATGKRRLDADYAMRHPEVTPGDYAMIAVSDTGSGMTPQVMSRIFEPFFTTKEAGKGTGLGLSMVFGFIKQSGGHIGVYSEPDAGTTFRLYLPRAAEDAPRVEPPVPLALGGSETVLVVEDDPAIRRLLVRQLRELGYRVLEVESGAMALWLLEREKIDLLLTDVVMPGEVDGRDLARDALARWPRLKVLLTSGFPEAKMSGHRESLAGLRLLSKPYRRDELARLLRETLKGDA